MTNICKLLYTENIVRISRHCVSDPCDSVKYSHSLINLSNSETVSFKQHRYSLKMDLLKCTPFVLPCLCKCFFVHLCFCTCLFVSDHHLVKYSIFTLCSCSSTSRAWHQWCQGHILIKCIGQMCCKSLRIKASAKCIQINVM